MPKFFVPPAGAISRETAEQVYDDCVKNSGPYPLKNQARIFRISFSHRGLNPNRVSQCVAEVGSEITNWPERAGPVLAIIETDGLVHVHTAASRIGRGTIMVQPDEVSERVYFDDYPI
jgi:hypothetical protein